MADLEKDYDYKDEHFDFIQQAVSTLTESDHLTMLTISLPGAQVLLAVRGQPVLHQCQGGQELWLTLQIFSAQNLSLSFQGGKNV